MSKKDLGFDPTIIEKNGQRYIDIYRLGESERIFITRVISRSRCIAGRATTCWLAYSNKDPATPLVVKDSWHYTMRAEEGEMLQEATKNRVVNVARYYHHETVQVDDTDDDILANVRHGLAVEDKPRPGRRLRATERTQQQSRSSSAARKRPSSEAGFPESPTKRSASEATEPVQNRMHRRVILRDYGKPVYKATTRQALLMALEKCSNGHESLLDAGILHRDVSINNLVMGEDEKDVLLIDLDLAIKVQRTEASGAKGKTGTRAFMAIGALEGQEHSFMHDLESFFWVLFWICIHYNGTAKEIGPTRFDDWNYQDDGNLASLKAGTIAAQRRFLGVVSDYFTPFNKPLGPLLNRLRIVVFPGGSPWERENRQLYSQIKAILVTGQQDSDSLSS